MPASASEKVTGNASKRFGFQLFFLCLVTEPVRPVARHGPSIEDCETSFRVAFREPFPEQRMNAPSQATDPASDRLPGRRSIGWRSLLAAALLVVVLLAPFVLVDVPPVLDYPNHLARYFVLAHPDDPVLSRMYEIRWAILPNLGMDVLGVALLRVTDLHVGGRILLAVSLLAPVLGAVAYHRAVFREWSWWPLASGLVAYNGAFFLGFMNFLLSLGLALMAAAMWIALQRRNIRLVQVTCGAVAAAVLFFCHIFGVVFFAVLIGAYEASLLWDRYKSGALAARDIVITALAGAVALSPALVLYLLSPLNTGPASAGEWKGLAKLWRILAPFMTSSAELTLITAIAVFSLLILFRRKLEFAPGLPLAMAGLALAFVAAPSSLKGGTFIDLRFAMMMGLLLFAGIQPRLTVREGAFAALALGALIAVRSFHIGSTWIDHRQDLAEVRAAIAMVEPGSRVLAARGRPGHVVGAEPEERALPGIYRLDGHLAALLTSERKAFFPLLFADPVQQPLAVRPPFDRIAQPLVEPAEWPWLSEQPLSPDARLRARYLAQWQRDFDYVLLIDAPADVQPHPALSLLHRGNYAQLYRVNRP